MGQMSKLEMVQMGSDFGVASIDERSYNLGPIILESCKLILGFRNFSPQVNCL